MIVITNYFFFTITRNFVDENNLNSQSVKIKVNYHTSIFRSFIVVAVLIVIGMCIFTLSEGWSFLDSLYFSVVTCSTVGYGDLIPKSLFGILFACVYMIFGSVIFILFVSLEIHY